MTRWRNYDETLKYSGDVLGSIFCWVWLRALTLRWYRAWVAKLAFDTDLNIT
jgi:hypothetical protein